MKTLIIAVVAASFALTTAPADSFAGKRHAKKSGKSYLGHGRRRHFSRRDYDRLPIRITRPPNTSHYIYQDFPLWAAHAFQPHHKR
jgi:hypothetical protein